MPTALQTGQPNHFPRLHRQIWQSQGKRLMPHHQGAQLQQGIRPPLRRMGPSRGCQLPPEHPIDQPLFQQGNVLTSNRQLPHHLPLPHHRHPIAKALHIGQLVGDEDHRFALLRQPSQSREQKIFLRCRNARRRLIQNQGVDPQGKQPQHFQLLPFPHRQTADGSIGVEVETKLFTGFLKTFPAFSQPQTQAPPLPGNKVFQHRQRRKIQGILVQHANAQTNGRCRAVDANRLPINPNLPLIAAQKAAQDLN